VAPFLSLNEEIHFYEIGLKLENILLHYKELDLLIMPPVGLLRIGSLLFFN